MSLTDELNTQQKKAVETVNGRVLVLAGAGSGKTRVLTLRMAYLVKQHQISPQSILGLTFTNKAAAEMRHRVAALLDPSIAKSITLCTFHSFCMQILRREIQHLGYTPEFSLYDAKDVHRLINTIARDLLDHESELPSLSPTTEAIAAAKNKGLKPEEITAPESEWHADFTKNVYQRLQDSMRAYNAVDFDSLLFLTVELFEKYPEILSKYQDRYRYIMIDEYQDTNPVQYRLASLLASKNNNLCVVGDDDQSIYGWRGAEVKNILDFSQASVIKLEQNYRSTNTILKAANAVIGHNQKRHSKVLWSNRGEGTPIEVFHAPNEIQEAQAVVCRIDRLREKHGLRWSDFAILYRSNALSLNFEMALMKHAWKDGDRWVRGIPYQVFGGLEFYERREVKDLFAYLRIIANPQDQEALLRIINYPRRGVGEAALDALTAYNRTHNISLWKVLEGVCSGQPELMHLKEKLTGRALQGIQSFLDIIQTARAKFAKPPLFETVKWLIERIEFQKAIAEENKSTPARDFKWENVQEFVTAIADYEEQAREGDEAAASIPDFIASAPLQQQNWEKNSKKNTKENKVTLMTIHSAKGLEFPACFLIGMEDHIIPHEKSVKQTGIEEERRLMYVAITRAMKFLTISMACKRKRMGVDSLSRPSRFLFEIPKELTKATNWHEIG